MAPLRHGTVDQGHDGFETGAVALHQRGSIYSRFLHFVRFDLFGRFLSSRFIYFRFLSPPLVTGRASGLHVGFVD